MSELWIRKHRLIVASLDVSDLRITFTIEKSMTETPNYSEISIFNLSPATENQIIKTADHVILEAGYQNEPYGLIFDGDVVQPFRGKEDSITYRLTLISQDGDQFINDGFVNASYAAGQTPTSIANQVTSTATHPIEIAGLSENMEDKSLSRGKVCFGLARDYLHQIARTEHAAYYVCDGKVNIVKATDPPKGQIVSLTPTSGLVGAPEQTEDGVKAKCLLNPTLNINTFVHIDNKHVRQMKATRDSQPKQMDYDGVYRIIKLTHSGDTRGDEWYTTFVGVAQNASIPELTNTLRS